MSEAEEDCGARDRLSELLYHLKEIVEQEAILRAMVAKLATATAGQQRAAVLSQIEVEVIDHLGYHLAELRKPLAEELSKAYNEFGDEESKPTNFKGPKNGHLPGRRVAFP